MQQKKKTITSAQKTRNRFAVFGRIAISKKERSCIDPPA
jgi:hypothetical protein